MMRGKGMRLGMMRGGGLRGREVWRLWIAVERERRNLEREKMIMAIGGCGYRG